MFINYRDHGFTPVVLKIETDRWTAGVTIFEVGTNIDDIQYSSEKLFKSKDEAMKHSIAQGKKMIDDILGK